MKTVLVACHNPTLQNEVIWDDHTIVGYVDITPALKTQEEREAYFQIELDEIDEEEAQTKEELTNANIHENDRESAERFLEDLANRREGLEEDKAEYIDVERLSQLYYEGWDAIPKDLKVDIVLTAFCPLSQLSTNEITSLTGVYEDIFVKAPEFLKPGGQLIVTHDTTRRQPLLEKTFRIEYAQELPSHPERMETPVMILTKKTGGSKKTRRSKNAKRRTRRR